MSNLIPFSSGDMERTARHAGRAMERSKAQAVVRQARIDNETDVQLAKVDAVTAATGAAMSSVVRIAQTQRQLEQLAPEASNRLAFLADDHALAVADQLNDLRRKLRCS